MTTGCGPGCPSTHSHTVEPAELHEQHAAHDLRRRQWRAVYDAGDAASPDSAAILLMDDPYESIKALSAEHGDKFKRLRLHRQHAGHPVLGPAFAMPDRKRVEHLESLIRDAVELTRPADGDVLALTQTDGPDAPVPVIAIPTLAHPGVRTGCT